MESTPVVDVQKQHITIRHFTEQGIEDDMQAYSVIVVKDSEAKKQLTKLLKTVNYY